MPYLRFSVRNFIHPQHPTSKGRIWPIWPERAIRIWRRWSIPSGRKCRSLRAVGSVLQREVVLAREAGPIDHSAAQLLGELYGPRGRVTSHMRGYICRKNSGTVLSDIKSAYKFGPYCLDPAKRLLLKDGRSLALHGQVTAPYP